MPKIIKFSGSQKRLISEVQARHTRELGSVLDIIAKEHNILDDIKKNPQKWIFEDDWSGIYKIDEPKETIPGKKNKK